MSVNKTDYRLLTIITETVLESRLIDALEQCGAPGYTITDVRGKGDRGVRSAGWDQSGNIRVDVVCDEATANRALEHVRERFYENYAMIATLSPVEVLRPEKFSPR